jgi:hypothetical protein
VSDKERAQPPVPVQPCPRPQIRNRSPESPDLQDSDPLEPSGVDAVGGDGPGTLHDVGGEGCTIGLEVGTGLVPGVMADGFEVQDEGIEAPAMVQSGELPTQVGPPRRQYPRQGKQLDTTDT